MFWTSVKLSMRTEFISIHAVQSDVFTDESYDLKNSLFFPLFFLELAFSKEIQTVGTLFKTKCHCGPLF